MTQPFESRSFLQRPPGPRVRAGTAKTSASLSLSSPRTWLNTALALACSCLLAAVHNPLQAQATPAPPRVWVTPPPGDVQRGAALYQAQCTACHAVDRSQTGPAHRGVLGRRVGSLPGYKYSAELAQSRLRWTPQTLNAWLEDPESLVAGQRMGVQVEDAQERADLIAYLSTLK